MVRQLTQAAWDAKRAAAKAAAKAALAKSAEDEQRDAPEDSAEQGYSEWSKDQLTEELKARELPHSGTKDELIQRLEEDDQEAPEDGE